MRFGINTFLFTSPFKTRSTHLFPVFKKWGYDSVEIAIEAPEHIDPTKVKKALDENSLICGSVCACFGPGRDLRGSAKEQRDGVRYVKALIDHMVILECHTLIGPIYSVVGKANAVTPERKKKEFALVVKNLKILCQYAEERCVKICIEPLNRFETDFLNTCEQGLELVKAIDNLSAKLLLDTFHMNIEEKSQAKAIRKAGKYLGHFHACGSDRGTPGNDEIDWTSIVKALKAIRYKGDVVIESFTQDVKVIAKAAAIWRRMEPTTDEIAKKGIKFLKHSFK